MLRHISSLCILAIILVLLAPGNAYAYLDPGTGSIILQAIVGVFLALGAGWYALKDTIRKAFRKIIPPKVEPGKQDADHE